MRRAKPARNSWIIFIDVEGCPGCKKAGLLGDALWDDVCWHNLHGC